MARTTARRSYTRRMKQLATRQKYASSHIKNVWGNYPVGVRLYGRSVKSVRKFARKAKARGDVHLRGALQTPGYVRASARRRMYRPITPGAIAFR